MTHLHKMKVYTHTSCIVQLTLTPFCMNTFCRPVEVQPFLHEYVYRFVKVQPFLYLHSAIITGYQNICYINILIRFSFPKASFEWLDWSWCYSQSPTFACTPWTIGLSAYASRLNPDSETTTTTDFPGISNRLIIFYNISHFIGFNFYGSLTNLIWQYL